MTGARRFFIYGQWADNPKQAVQSTEAETKNKDDLSKSNVFMYVDTQMLLKCSARGTEGTHCDAEKKISNYHSTHTSRDPTKPWLDGANTRKAKPGGLKHTKRPRTEKPDPRTAARTTVVQPNHESILHFQNP